MDNIYLSMTEPLPLIKQLSEKLTALKNAVNSKKNSSNEFMNNTKSNLNKINESVSQLLLNIKEI